MLKWHLRGAAITPLLFAMALLQGLSARASSALLVWHFDQGISNSRGGVYSAYSRDPSSARTYLDTSVHRPGSGHSLRITAHREPAGFCGVWLEFYPAMSLPRRYLDANRYRFLSFWIRGSVAGGSFDAALEDDATPQNTNNNPNYPFKVLMPDGTETGWREVVLPLASFSGINTRHLSRLVLSFTAPGNSRFYIDDVAFRLEAATVLPEQGFATRASIKATLKHIYGMWAWNAAELLGDGGKSDRFFQFCTRTGVNRVFLALELEPSPTPSGTRFELLQPDDYREFLKRAHQSGLQVEALAGNPPWAAKENHSDALSVVDTVMDFNRTAPQSARFDGLHFDVEPYTLMGYADAENATRLLQEFLRLISMCAQRVHRQPGLSFTCDVPAYFYPAPGPDFQKFVVEFKGRRATVGEHLTGLLDSITLMDYYNEADGAGGAIASALPALRSAASKGKTILVGLETSLDPDSEVYFICGLPREEFRRRLNASGLGAALSVEGYRLVSISDDINIHVGLAAPALVNGPAREALDQALVRLARQFGAASDPHRFPAGNILEEARSALSNNPEWGGFETFRLMDPETGRPIEGFRIAYRMISRTTFHGLGPDVFAEETRSLLEWLSPYPSFGGLAIHHYESYRELLEGK